MKLFAIDKKPQKGLLGYEWVILGYAAITLLMVLFFFTSLKSPGAMILTRVKLTGTVLVMWGLYRLVPCRLMMLCRYIVQIMMLAEWYPDTYELNRILPNMDPMFAQWDQQIFGFQPSLLFAEKMPWTFFSEAMFFGYFSYYALLAVVPMLYFFRHYEEFQRVAFIVLASFFAYYAIYIIIPVAGPQYYYEAVGVEQIARGILPDVGSWFYSHTECLALPGNDGIFRDLVQMAHDTGERPTAAFPSSHVGASTVILCLAIRLCRKERSWFTLYWYVPLYILLCLSTVYIYAHYFVDTIAGLVSGIILYFILSLRIWKV